MFLKRINKLDWNTKWNRRINGKRCTLLLPVTSDAWKPELGASASPVCAECKCGHCPGDENPRSRVPKTRVQASVGWRWLPGVSGHSRYGFIHEHTKPSAVVSLCWITPLLSEGWGAFKLDESGLSERLLSILWGSHKQKRIPGTEHLPLLGIHDGCTITVVGNLVCLLHRAGSLWPGTDGRSPGDLLHFHRSATPGTGKPEEQFAGANKAS